MHAFNGLVLAGGKSSRMGQDKALMTIADEPLLARCQRILAETGAERILVSRNDGEPQHIADTFLDKGPLSGIYAAICQESTRPLLVLPVDLPLVTAPLLEHLVQEGTNRQTTCRYENHNLPVLIYRPAELLIPLQSTLINGRQLAVGHFLSRFPIQVLPLQSPNTLTNTNTPAEWRAIQIDPLHENML